jgi:hypothetical protein
MATHNHHDFPGAIIDKGNHPKVTLNRMGYSLFEVCLFNFLELLTNW